MIKPGALIMAAAMTAVAAGTYFGLDMLKPGTIPPPFGRVPPVQPHVSGASTVADSAPAAAPTTAPAPAPEAAPAPAASTTAPTEQELAEEPAPKAEPAVVAAATPAAAPKEEPKAEPKPEPKPEPVAAEPAPVAVAPKPQPAPVAAAPKPQPAPKPASAAAAPPPAPAPTTTASAEPTEPAEPPVPMTPSNTTADSDVIKQWWPDPAKLPANQLKLQYAGDVQGETAIGLLFSEAPDLDSLKRHGHIREISGAEVSGVWAAGKNPRLVVFRGLKAGTRYTVILDKELADARGFALGQTLQGPVYIPKR